MTDKSAFGVQEASSLYISPKVERRRLRIVNVLHEYAGGRIILSVTYLCMRLRFITKECAECKRQEMELIHQMRRDPVIIRAWGWG